MFLIFQKIESPSHKIFVPSLVEIGPVVLEKIFFNFVNVFSLFHNLNNLLLEKGGVLHSKKLKSPSLKESLCQVWLKLAQWFWRWRLQNFVNVFLLFRNHLPLERDSTLHLNTLESPSLKDALCQVWLKLAQWFWRRRFFNLVNVFSLFHNYESVFSVWCL